MPLRILVVPDKFKGTLTAQAAAATIAAGWREARPADVVELLPMSDGGDGFGEVLAPLLKADQQTAVTIDAAHRRCVAQWWWAPETHTAVIESARVIGLALLPKGQYHPFVMDTRGLAPMLESAVQAGSKEVLLGIGGSATNDAGFGLAKAAGWQFFNARGDLIQQWIELKDLDRIQPPAARFRLGRVTVAVDVQNPLLGPDGASRIYGPQKGLRPEDIPSAEKCLGRLAQVVERQLGQSAATAPGSGAAGGLGFGLRCFFEARLESGFNLFARWARLEERIRSADLVITGEGAIDSSTAMGKGVGEIASLCRRYGVPCLGLAGRLSLRNANADKGPFTRVYGIAPRFTSAESAMSAAEMWLRHIAGVAAREWTQDR